MANKHTKWTENAPGTWYVDEECIACDTCVTVARANFKLTPDNDHAYISKQPQNADELAKCQDALDCCPVDAIGNNG